MDTVMGGSDGSRLGCVVFVCNNNNAVRLVGPRNLIIGDDTHRWYYFFFFFFFTPLCVSSSFGSLGERVLIF